MSTAVENLGKLERKMTLSFARADLAQEKSARLAKLCKTVRLAGFRPGKVPLKVVERQYGPQVEIEAQFDRAANLFFEAVRAQSIRLVGQPRFEPKQIADENNDEIIFDALFEVYPEIAIGDLSKLELTRVQTVVGDAEITKTLDILRKQRAHFHPRGEAGHHGDGGENVAAQTGDRLTVDFVGKIDDVEFAGGKAEGFTFELGQGRMLPEFEQAALGMKVGETKQFILPFPAEYQNQEVAGKNAEFSLTVKQIEWPHLPEIDEAFARSLGVADGSVEKMHADIRENLEREVKRRVTAMLKNQVMEGLLSCATLDVPNALLEQEKQHLVEMARQDMLARGMANAKNMPIPGEIFASQAERRVKLGLILGELVKAENIKVTPEQVNAQIAELAQSYQDPEEIKRWYQADRSRLKEIESVVLESNVVEFVCSRANLQDKVMSFDELTTTPAE